MVLDIRYLSNAMIVNKDRAKIPPKLIMLSTVTKSRSAKAKYSIRLRNLSLLFHSFIVMIKSSKLPNTAMADAVILTETSTLSQNLLHINMFGFMQTNGRLEQMRFCF